MPRTILSPTRPPLVQVQRATREQPSPAPPPNSSLIWKRYMPCFPKAFRICHSEPRSGGELAVLSPPAEKQIPRSLSPRVARLRAARNDNDWNFKADTEN